MFRIEIGDENFVGGALVENELVFQGGFDEKTGSLIGFEGSEVGAIDAGADFADVVVVEGHGDADANGLAGITLPPRGAVADDGYQIAGGVAGMDGTDLEIADVALVMGAADGEHEITAAGPAGLHIGDGVGAGDVAGVEETSHFGVGEPGDITGVDVLLGQRAQIYGATEVAAFIGHGCGSWSGMWQAM